MKKIALSILCLSTIGVCVAAPPMQAPDQPQERRGPRGGRKMPDPQQRVDMLGKRLELTDDQKQKLLPIFTDEQQQMKSLAGDSALSRKDRFDKMRSLREDSDQKLSALLTDDQKQKYSKMKDRMKERMHERMKERKSQQSDQAPAPAPDK